MTEPDLCSTSFIRFPSSEGHKTIKDFLTAYPLPKEFSFYDHQEPIRSELLSCNPHLFSNFDRRGESTWDLYLNDDDTGDAQKNESFFRDLFKRHHIPFTRNDLEEMISLYEELVDLCQRFNQLGKLPGTRSSENMILQILVPRQLIDSVAYAATDFGHASPSELPLSQRCLSLRENPIKETTLQVRVLAQSILVPDHHIKVFAHGCGGFFADEDPIRLTSNSKEYWEAQQHCFAKKKEILVQINEYLTKMMLRSSIKPE
jgi:hypothetical protein